MRVNILILILACALPLLGSYVMQRQGLSRQADVISATGQSIAIAVPDFSFSDLAGKTHSIEAFKGRIIVLNFWATWCAPCVAEFPRLLALAEDRDIVLVALSLDDDPQKIERFIEKLDPQSRRRIKLESVVMGRDAEMKISQDLFQTFRLPETILIDRAMTARAKIVGGEWKTGDVEKILAGIETKAP